MKVKLVVGRDMFVQTCGDWAIFLYLSKTAGTQKQQNLVTRKRKYYECQKKKLEP